MSRLLKGALILVTVVFLVLLGMSFGFVYQYNYSLLEAPTEVIQLSPIEWESSIVKVVEEVSPSVVSIIASKDVPVVTSSPFYHEEDTQRRDVGGGTGFLISEDGLIITNRHVVSDEEAEYTVFTNDGNSFIAEVLDRDPVYDLAVLNIEGSDFPVVTLGDSEGIKIGQTAIVIGNALGEFRNTVNVGVISGLGRSIVATDGLVAEVLDDVIQTDAGINRGNSGGPLLNLKREVVGINTAMATTAQNIGFAIPINNAKRAIDSVIKHGRIVYPFLGVRYLMIDEDVSKERDLPVTYGALLISDDISPAVDPDSGAFNAGLIENDIILKVGEEEVNEKNSLVSLIIKYYPGDTVTLLILRDGVEMEVDVTLSERTS